MSAEDELMAEGILGDEAKRFLEGDLGKYMRGCADQDIQEAILDLGAADPQDTKAIRDIQNRIWRARNFSGWLIELVQRGEEALRVYQQQKQED